MTAAFTAGMWWPHPGHEEAFVDAWTEFARWLRTMDGPEAPRLLHDLGDPTRWFSIAEWRDIDAVHAWKSHPEFRERMARVQEHVAQFKPIEYELVVEVQAAAG